MGMTIGGTLLLVPYGLVFLESLPSLPNAFPSQNNLLLSWAEFFWLPLLLFEESRNSNLSYRHYHLILGTVELQITLQLGHRSTNYTVCVFLSTKSNLRYIFRVIFSVCMLPTRHFLRIIIVSFVFIEYSTLNRLRGDSRC